MLASLGKDPTDDYLEGMMNEAPGPINFTMFLTMFGERLQGTDPEDVIKNAFGCFDEENVGVLHEDRLRELLTTIGDRYTDTTININSQTDKDKRTTNKQTRFALHYIPYVIYVFSWCRFTDDDVDEMYREAPIKNGMFDYVEFTRILKHGAKEKDEV